MNEMDLLSRMRAEVPDAPASARAEGVLLAAISGRETHGARPDRAAGRFRRGWQARPSGQIRPAWRVAVAAGLCLALGAGATAGLTLRHPAAPVHPSATAGHHPGASGMGGVALTARVLADRAARAAAARPPVSPNQWFWLSAVQSGLATRIHLGKPSVGWKTADNSKEAGYLHGKLYVEMGAQSAEVLRYSALAGLPRDPAALVRYLGHRRLPPILRVGFAAQAMGQIEGLLGTFVMPPRLTAEIYRALGDIPGMQVRQGLTDIEGRRGTGFFFREHDSFSTVDELILNPRTYTYMGSNVFQHIHGTEEMSGTAITLAPVRGPGVRP